MDNTGALLRGTSEIPHKSEPPELEDVEEETEVRGKQKSSPLSKKSCTLKVEIIKSSVLCH